MLLKSHRKLTQIWNLKGCVFKLTHQHSQWLGQICTPARRCTYYLLSCIGLRVTEAHTYQSRAILDNLPVMLRQRLACVVNSGLFAQVSISFVGCFLLDVNAPLPSHCVYTRWPIIAHYAPCLTMTSERIPVSDISVCIQTVSVLMVLIRYPFGPRYQTSSI